MGSRHSINRESKTLKRPHRLLKPDVAQLPAWLSHTL